MNKKCKHKIHTTANVEIGGYNIPDGVTTEYDIVCAECGEKLGHWAYGYPDLEYHLNYELNWWKRILAKLHMKLIDSRCNVNIKKIRRKNNIKDDEDLPF